MYTEIEVQQCNIVEECPYCGTETNTHFQEWGVNLTPEALEEFEEEGGHQGIVCEVCHRYVTNEEMEA
jgi:hypothetical protein